MNRKVGYIGLGKMGQAMVLHILEQGIPVIGFNRTKDTTVQFEGRIVSEFGQEKVNLFTPIYSIESFLTDQSTPRVIFLMVKAGKPIDEMVSQLLEMGLTKGDIIIDGGNSFYKDTVRRHKALSENGIAYIDCGTSGGIRGARSGACLMIGGDEQAVLSVSWLWEAVAAKGGWAFFGPSGAGHFVKMVHNGIEYGMNQALGEGFEILSKGPYKLDYGKIADNWMHGSVVRSWLVELLKEAFEQDPGLESKTGIVGGGETGTWTRETAKDLSVNIPVIDASIQAREDSKITQTFSGKVVSALRFEYGEHEEPQQ